MTGALLLLCIGGLFKSDGLGWGLLEKFVKINSFSNEGSTLFIRLNIATYFICLDISGYASNYDVIISS